jgi:hypothetical protein
VAGPSGPRRCARGTTVGRHTDTDTDTDPHTGLTASCDAIAVEVGDAPTDVDTNFAVPGITCGEADTVGPPGVGDLDIGEAVASGDEEWTLTLEGDAGTDFALFAFDGAGNRPRCTTAFRRRWSVRT